jgi:hypothetical protein
MKKAFNFLLALFPILSGYGLSLSLDFGSILLFVFGMGCVLAYPRKFRITMPVGYMAFFVVALLLALFWARNVPLRLLLFSVNLCFACCYAEKDKLWKYYSVIVWMCATFFLVQEVSFLLFGSRPGGLLPFLPTIYGGDTGSRIAAVSIDERSSSFFLEPSYCAQFMIPYVAICLFSSKKDSLKKAIAASIIIVLIRSGVGIILLGLIWIFWFLFSNLKFGVKICSLILALSLVGALIYTNSGILSYFSGRSGELLSFTGEEQYQSSGFIRFFRGYFAFAAVPTLDKLLGMNPTVVHFFLERSIYFGTDESYFINGMQTLLFYHGIVGTVLYIRHLVLIPYKFGSKSLIVMSVCIIILLLSESFYLSSRLFLMTVFMYLIREEYRINKDAEKQIKPIMETIS